MCRTNSYSKEVATLKISTENLAKNLTENHRTNEYAACETFANHSPSPLGERVPKAGEGLRGLLYKKIRRALLMMGASAFTLY